MYGAKRLGVGLIGGGFMAKAHSNAYHTIPYIYNNPSYNLDLACIGEISEDFAKAAQRRYGFKNAVVGYEAVVNDPAVDLVDICVSDALHKEIALAALKAGKHVLCEKPLALNSNDALIMRDAAKKSKLKVMSGYNYRFVAAITLAKRLIESGRMGRVYNFYGDYSQDVGAWEDTPLESLWYAYGPKSSGVTIGIGTHIIDMARFLVGEIDMISSMLTNFNPVRTSAGGPVQVTNDEEMTSIVKFENGATGNLRASAVSAGRKNCMRFEISCSKGSIVFNLEDLNYLDIFYRESVFEEAAGFTRINVTQKERNHPYMDVWWPRGHIVGWEHAHINEIAHLLDCIANDKPISPMGATFEDGYRACRIIDAIKESAISSQFVKITY